MADPGQLYIRWSATGSDDNRTDPGGAVWYLSASLTVWNADGTVQTAGEASVGTDHKVRVNVDTLLTKPNVGVQVWVCAYGLAGQPFLGSALLEKGLEKHLDDATPPQPYTATSGAQLSIDVPWTPQTTDLTDLGFADTDDLHVCLLANCYATPPGAAPDGQFIVGPPRPPIDVPNNRHHAQHNILLKGLPAGGGGMGMDMFAGNPAQEGEERFLIQVEELALEEIGPELVELVLNSRWAKVLEEGKGLRPAGKPADVKLEAGGASGTELEVVFQAERPQRVRLESSFGEREENVVRVFDLVQRRGREAVGGARLVTLGVPDDVLRELNRR